MVRPARRADSDQVDPVEVSVLGSLRDRDRGHRPHGGNVLCGYAEHATEFEREHVIRLGLPTIASETVAADPVAARTVTEHNPLHGAANGSDTRRLAEAVAAAYATQ